MIGALPPVHELAKQAGTELPEALDKIDDLTDDAMPPRPPADQNPAAPA